MRSRLAFLVSLGTALMLGPTVAAVPPAATLDVADVAYLWPVPKSPADVDSLITCSTPTADGSPLLPQPAFDSILEAVASTAIPDGAGRPIKITFDSFFADRLKQPATWKIVGFRFDPETIGHPETLASFGVMPQLRLIAQPVTVDNGRVNVHDLAAHLVFGYFTGPAPFKADQAKLAEMIKDLGDLKAASPAPTAGPLGVHPGLKTRDAAFAAMVKTFIAKWTAPSKGPLAAISFMGLDTPEPWIFFALKPAAGGRFVPAAQPTLGGSHAQMISFRSGDAEILPRSTGVNTGAAGKIVSTAPLFDGGLTANLDAPAAAGLPQVLRKDIPNYIANPKFGHVFNTDCVSCHTETTRREQLSLSGHAGTFGYVRPDGISGVDPAVVPRNGWNVRNFGWFRQDATITLRAANEIADSVAAIRRLGAAPAAPPSGAAQAQLLRVSFRPEPRPAPAVATPPPPPATPRPTVEPPVPVATPLTLVMEARSPQDMEALKALIAGMQAKPPDQNPIRVALNELRIVHFARFVFLDDTHLAIVTTFDGSFDDYIDAFVNTIGDVFNALMRHVKDAPPLPVQANREAFLAYVKAHDKGAVQPFYSAYPDLTVGEILTLQHEAAQRRASQP
jgi:hypothetical protein